MYHNSDVTALHMACVNVEQLSKHLHTIEMAQHCTSNSPAHFHLHFSRICTYAHALWRKGPWNWIRKHSFLSVSLTTVCKPPLLTPPVSSLCVFQSAARFCPGSISSTTSFQADYHNFFSTASPVYHFAILGKFGYFFAILCLVSLNLLFDDMVIFCWWYHHEKEQTRKLFLNYATDGQCNCSFSCLHISLSSSYYHRSNHPLP